MLTKYQEEVIAELKEMERVKMFSRQTLLVAIDITEANEGNTFAESSAMSTSEAADLAVELTYQEG